jgi:hypothetical protein
MLQTSSPAATRYYVAVDRADGSRTYKGSLSLARAEREADAWRASFPDYAVSILPVTAARVDFRRWAKVTAPTVDAPRYFPPEAAELADGRHLCDPCYNAETIACSAGLRPSWDVRGLSALPAATVRCASCGAVL